MRLLIIGGSNSIIKDGYVSHLEDFLEDDYSLVIKNLAVGATTTLAAIGRLQDSFEDEVFDFILYEYSLNDIHHLGSREAGESSWELIFYLLVKTAANLYPDAVLVPLVFTVEKYFSNLIPNLFHDTQINNFKKLDLPYINIREWMSELFLGDKPSWMYEDSLHYSRPYATSMIGAQVAKHLISLKNTNNKLSDIYIKLIKSTHFSNVEMVYFAAHKFENFIDGKFKKKNSANKLMKLDYLRMYQASNLTLDIGMFPLVLFIKSDCNHAAIKINLLINNKIFDSLVISRHAAVDNKNFVYAAIPLPFLWGQKLVTSFLSSVMTLTVPVECEITENTVRFDGFEIEPTKVTEQYLDLIGILFVLEN